MTPDTARHRLATTTPADCTPARDVPSSRRTSMKPRKITLKGAPCGASLRDALRAPLTVLFLGSDRAYQKDGQDWTDAKLFI